MLFFFWFLLLWIEVVWGDVRPNDLSCDHGFLKLPSRPTCYCENDWGGIGCDMCSTSNVCSGDQICDTSLLLGNHKHYECSIENENLRNIVGDVMQIHCTTTECQLLVWGKQPSFLNPEFLEYHKVFQCSIFNTSSTYDYETKDLTTHSDQSHCFCFDDSKFCQDQAAYLIPMLKQKI